MRKALVPLIAFAMALALGVTSAFAGDIDVCFVTADRIARGEQVSDADRKAGHEACQRALAATASLMQKQDIQEADFDILGTRPKP
jgi:hypothetical protein